MTHRSSDDKSFSLRRWSQRKAAARAAPRADAERGEAAQVAAPSAGAVTVTAMPGEQRTSLPAVDAPVPASAPDVLARAAASPVPAPALPALDSLSIESDFTGFMQPGVDESLKRGALKKLFSDPRFNVMDGLDVYIDDYSKPDPLDPAIARTLAHARYIFNPPPTRVTAAGYVEDIPEEELRAARDAGSEAADELHVAGQDTAVALPGVQPEDDAVPCIAQQRDDAVPSITQQVEDAVPAANAKPEAA